MNNPAARPHPTVCDHSAKTQHSTRALYPLSCSSGSPTWFVAAVPLIPRRLCQTWRCKSPSAFIGRVSSGWAQVCARPIDRRPPSGCTWCPGGWHLSEGPVHAHLQSGLQVGGGGGDDALRPHAHGDVVEQGLGQLLLHPRHILLHLHSPAHNLESQLSKEDDVVCWNV